MTRLEPSVKKEIAKCLNTAIDCELSADYEQAYKFYVEGLFLVSDVLKRDLTTQELTLRDRCNLIQFAKQSLGRVTGLFGGKDPNSYEKCDGGDLSFPSAPEDIQPPINGPPPPYSPEEFLKEDAMMMAKYQSRLGLASCALGRPDIEMKVAQQLFEKAANSRNNIVRATAWAMQNAHKFLSMPVLSLLILRKFKIQEKLTNGKLRESDFRKQQLYTISVQFNEGNTWLSQLLEDLTLYPDNSKVAREMLDVVLTDNSHPIKATINQMQDKIAVMVTDAMIDVDTSSQVKAFDEICRVIKEDINILQEVVKALFEPLKTVRNSYLTSETVHHIYFSQIKLPLISLIKIIHRELKKSLDEKMKAQSPEGESCSSNECFREAVSKLHFLTTLHNPYDMLDCTVHIIKLLATSRFDRAHCSSMGADDLLPRLCHVVLACGIPTIYAEAYFMEAFMPSDKALGEEGYAVTMLQSAIAHITRLTSPD